MPIPLGNTAANHEASSPKAGLQMPPPPPRPISNRYIWRLLETDGWTVAAFVFGLLGTIFCLLGIALTAGIVTAFVGIPFTGLGFLFLIAGAALAVWRYREMQKIVEVLRTGETVEGQIVQVEENPNVQVNGRSPWVIRYQFHLEGQLYEGQVTTLNVPGAALQLGKPAYVLYRPQTPSANVLYPHP
jgi:membrane protein implicated in regulation of membrane protease activity